MEMLNHSCRRSIDDPFEIHKCESGDYIYISSMQEIKEYRGRNIKNNTNNIHSSTQTHARTQSLREKKEQKEKKKKRGDQQSIDHSRENNNRNTDRHSLDQQHSSPIYTHNTIRTAFNIHRDGNRTTTRAQQERERENIREE